MRSRVLLLGSMALLATWLTSSTAWAVPPRTGGAGTADTAAWRALFDQGRQAYDLGEYEDAAEAFFRAREAGGPPSLLYNQALCLDRLERLDAAASVYRQFLAASPTAANRAEVEARLREIDGSGGGSGGTSSGRLATRVAPTPPVMQMMPLEGGFEAVIVGEGRPVVRSDGGPRVEEVGPEWVVSWFLLAGTLASTGAAIGVWIDGQATFDLLRSDCAARGGCSEGEIADSSAHVSETATNVLVVASALLGTATVISFLAEGYGTSGTRVYVDLGPGSLQLRGSF